MKLWEKGYNPSKTIERFTVGEDPVLDMDLLPYDIQASKAHVLVLQEAGILTDKEHRELLIALSEIEEKIASSDFTIQLEDEDGHTAIEKYLIERLGETGKKIHTARSRNDQVLTALRLYEKDFLATIGESLTGLIEQFNLFSQSVIAQVPMPGYTHTRKAMPYTVSEWAEAYRAALRDDEQLLNSVSSIIDANPLGTGAGYGVSLPINRSLSTEYLKFGKTIESNAYAQLSRGKMEAHVLYACSSILATLNRWSSDLILFTMPELGYFELPLEMTTGSSIMPHKTNPDVLELIRASLHQVNAYQMELMHLSANLISGYHRDQQLGKKPLMEGLKVTLDCIRISTEVMRGLKVKKEELNMAMTPELYSVQKAYELVQKGIPFREAYKIIASEFSKPKD